MDPRSRRISVLLFHPEANPRNLIIRWLITEDEDWSTLPIADMIENGKLQNFLRRWYRFEVDVESIIFYKPSPPILNDDAEARLTSKEAIESSANVVGYYKYLEAFCNGIGEAELNMIIVAEGTKVVADRNTGANLPTIHASRSLSTVNSYHTRLEAYVEKDATIETPSKVAVLSTYRRRQGDANTTIYNGRYPSGNSGGQQRSGVEPSTHIGNTYFDTTALPVQLYSQVFARFTARVGSQDPDFTIPVKVMEDCSQLILLASAIYPDENTRSDHLRETYNKVFYCIFSEASVGHGQLDGTVMIKLDNNLALLAAFDEKNEQGAGGCDVNVQVSVGAKRFWLGNNGIDVRKRACCPTLLLGFDGPLFTVSGAVLTDKWIVQPLAIYSLSRESSLDDKHHQNVCRIMYACRLAISELDTYYHTVDLSTSLPAELPNDHPRWFPAATAYRDDTGNPKTFVYKRSLTSGPRCAVFLVEEVEVVEDGGEESKESERLRVVKFSERYGAEVHRHLAEQNLAPKLLYSGPPFVDGTLYDNVQMTVMEYIDGFGLQKQTSLKPSQQSQLRQAVDLLRQKGFVHGDLRKPNILIDSKSSDIKIIDFEWAGNEGKVSYPRYLNEAEFIGCKAFELIKHEHDAALIESIVGDAMDTS